MAIPLLDLQAQFETIRSDVLSAVMEVAERQKFILGEPVSRLEGAVAQLSGTRFGVGCASGTDALLLSLKVLDLRPGDEVITTPFTFFASAGAIVNAGGRPVFVDIDPQTFNLDVRQLEEAITSRTRAVMPVHLFGQIAAMEQILPIAERQGLAVVEDAAQAIGARRNIGGKWRVAGGMGTTGGFSFFPSKNLGGWGDGGMIVTADEQLAGRLRRLRTHGGAKMYVHEEVGTNSRLDAIQAAILLAKLPHLERWAAARRANACAYSREFQDKDGVVPPTTDKNNEHVFNQYTVRAASRDQLKERLTERGIGSAVYYPRPLHLQPCFADLGYTKGRFPVSERAAEDVLSLPVYPELRAEQRDTVISVIQEFYR